MDDDIKKIKITGEGKKRKKKVKKKVKKRPRRLYKEKKGIYYFKNGKKKYIKLSKPSISQKQTVKINIRNLVDMSVKRRQKRRIVPRLSKKIDEKLDAVQSKGLPGFTFMKAPADRRLKNIEEQQKEKEVEKEKKEKFDLSAFFKNLKMQTVPTESVETQTDEFMREGESKVADVELEEKVTEEKEEPAPIRKGKKKPQRRTFVRIVKEFFKETEDTDFLNFISWFRSSKYDDLYDVDTLIVNQNDFSKTSRLFEETIRGEIKGSGNYLITDGLWNHELEVLSKKFLKHYCPVLASDQIDKLDELYDGSDNFMFIVNTNPSKSDGTGLDGFRPGHWTAVFIDKDDATCEYFDPLVETGIMPDRVKKVCKKIAEKMRDDIMFKIKENKLIRQATSADTCGLHCIQFLSDRLSGESFSEASGYDDFLERTKFDDGEDGEKEIKNNFKNFRKYL